MARTTLMLITGRVDWGRREEIAAGRYPRKDYFELARALDADIIDHTSLPTGRLGRLLMRCLGADAMMAWQGFRRRRDYQLLFSDSEAIGIPLALLLKLARDARPHLSIAHYLTPFKKRLFFRYARVHSHISALIVHASRQRQRAVEELGIPGDKVALLPYQVDQEWWEAEATTTEERPVAPAAESMPSEAGSADWPIISSAGLERRDYPTLLRAVEGLPVRVVIAAASHWSKQGSDLHGRPLPANVEITSLDYRGLRDLYARSAFVVMPLQDVDFQAGITTILEAMAMGKAVVVSHSLGQEDVVIDRRTSTRGAEERALPPGFGRSAGDYGPTGLYVPVGDAEALRRSIRFLLENPEMASSLGANGRRLAAEVMSLDAFAERIADLADEAIDAARPTGQPQPALP